MRTIQAQIMSRTRLEHIIEEYNLYPEDRRNGLMEDVVERMRGDISVGLKQGDVFSVAYAGDNPRTVMKVAEQLAGLFIEENTSERERLATARVNSSTRPLRTLGNDSLIPRRTSESTSRNTWAQLPQQLEANLQAMSQTMNQVQQLNDGINRDREQKLFLEKQLKELEAVSWNERPRSASDADSGHSGESRPRHRRHGGAAARNRQGVPGSVAEQVLRHLARREGLEAHRARGTGEG